jgi:hypothetical protein
LNNGGSISLSVRTERHPNLKDPPRLIPIVSSCGCSSAQLIRFATLIESYRLTTNKRARQAKQYQFKDASKPTKHCNGVVIKGTERSRA